LTFILERRLLSSREVSPALLKEASMERDVVCGMDVDPDKAAGSSQFNGKIYYFCSKGCKTKFDADPQKYTK
jgi:YHS domain-containing protein